ncbi:GntR family transcriptional regulator [Paenarthrobacter sp. DKR-5]|uniref:GntR family transcriptional regulator n=1 Tax=Paenarthrobacter sp. DKR-5 TaxID=2835535 RepID=UPI001BDCFA61|nr:GntR family transcriptional regulator [Paenarthrobacter sp. DKR-5]MBT1002197.1 GntR family transcriptional regulator [Paenarthrobacter sp. DKR-5]
MRASDRAYAALRDEIIEWKLPPGTVLAEVEQSERLGVSRTPLREALARLGADGLTAAHAGRGVVVTDISLDHLAELFELREALEGKAAALAAERGESAVFAALRAEFEDASRLLTDTDPGRHAYYDLVSRLDAAVDDAAANAYLVQALKNLRVHLVRVRRLSLDDPARLLAAATEHATIAAAIAERNPALAVAATTVHLHQSLRHLQATQREEKAL